jgi:hypothetical protein
MNNVTLVILNEQTILKVKHVITTGTLGYVNERASRELNDATDLLMAAFNNKQNSFKEMCFWKGMVETLLDQFSNEEPEVAILFIRNLTDKNINIRYSENPTFKDFVLKYGLILRVARQF